MSGGDFTVQLRLEDARKGRFGWRTPFLLLNMYLTTFEGSLGEVDDKVVDRFVSAATAPVQYHKQAQPWKRRVARQLHKEERLLCVGHWQALRTDTNDRARWITSLCFLHSEPAG